jgi:hypothetical protein
MAIFTSASSNQLHRTHVESLSSPQNAAFHALPINKGPIGRAAIPHFDASFSQEQLTMHRGDGGVIDLEMGLAAAAELVYPQLKFITRLRQVGTMDT